MRHFDIRRKLRKAGASVDSTGVLELQLWNRSEDNKVVVSVVVADTTPDGDILGYDRRYFNVDRIAVGRDNDGKEFISLYVTNRIDGSWADLDGENLTLQNWDDIFSQL